MRSSLLRLSRVLHSPPINNSSIQSRNISQQATATATRSNTINYQYRTTTAEFTESELQERRLQTEDSSYNSTSTTTNKQTEKDTDTISRSKQAITTAQPSTRRPQPKNTADSSFASTSKLSLPPSSSSRSPNSAHTSPSSPAIPSATTSLSSIPLPNSERSLFLLLRQLQSTYPSIPPSWYFTFHSQPYFTPFVSSRTYTFLLSLGFKRSNLWVVEQVLKEMENREIGLDEKGLRVLLRGYRGTGEEKKWRDVLERLEEEMGKEGREWVVEGRNTKRLNLGSKGKGKAKEIQEEGGLRGGEGVGWKGWMIRGRDVKVLAQEEEGSRREEMTATKSTHRTRIKKKPPASLVRPQRRPRVLIPPLPHRLSSSSATNLTQLLVSDQRTDDAFSLADTWLAHNRPSLPSDPSSSSPSPALIQSTHEYNSTLLVFLNILLKPLLLARSSISTILSFPTTFIARHAPPSLLPQPEPGLSTIREILSGLQGMEGKSSWNRGRRVVDHFGYRWGIPIGDGGFEGEERVRFRQPSNPQTRERLCLGPLPTGESEEGVFVKPHTIVHPSISVLLLQLAVETHSSPQIRLTSDQIKEFREWWKGVSEKEQGTDWLKGSKARFLIVRAGEVGLLEKDAQESKRRDWFREQKLYESRRKGKGK